MGRKELSGHLKTALFYCYTLSAIFLAPTAFAQAGSDWSEYEETIRGGINVAKQGIKGGGEILFGLLPIVALVMGGFGAWFTARKKAEREDKDTKFVPLLWGLLGAVLGFGLTLFVYIGLEKGGIPARQKAMDFWR